MPEGRSIVDGRRLMNSPTAAAAIQKGGVMMYRKGIGKSAHRKRIPSNRR